MPSPKISVIIPAYKAADTIMASLNSVFAQTYQDYEVIIVNDRSPDNLNEMLDTIKNARVKIINHETNLGASAARNTGITAAKGDYVAFLDSDDVWYPHKLQMQLDFMTATDNSVKANCTSFAMLRTNGRKNDRILERDKNWNQIMLGGCTVSPGSTMMAERTLFNNDNIGPYNTQLRRLEDWDWLLSYCSKYKLGVIEEVLVEVRVSGYPSYHIAKNAAEKIWELKENFVRHNYGTKAVDFFKAGIEVENCGTAFRNKKYAVAMTHLMRATITSPARAMHLIKRVVQKLKTADFALD